MDLGEHLTRVWVQLSGLWERCCVVLCCVVLCCVVLCCVVLCCAVLCCVVLCCAVLCCVVLCCVVLCCVVLCCVVLCCVVLCCVVPKALLPEGKGRDVYPLVQVNGRRGGPCACPGCGALVALPSHRARPFGLCAAALQAGPAAPSTAHTAHGPVTVVTVTGGGSVPDGVVVGLVAALLNSVL